MSKGYGASCRKVSEDSECVLYEYYAYNLNDEKLRNPDRIYDGTILIQRSCLVEPEIHTKLKRMPKGRKKTIEKRIPVEVELSECLSAGQIEITNSSFSWHFVSDNIDIMAIHLCRKVFREYQETSMLPETCGYHV